MIRNLSSQLLASSSKVRSSILLPLQFRQSLPNTLPSHPRAYTHTSTPIYTSQSLSSQKNSSPFVKRSFASVFSRSFSTANKHYQKIRNVAIIAHVDHGKTSLVDQLLRQSGSIKENSNERVMDSNQLEKERGITILAKCTSIRWKDFQLNIVDTPGHGDFGGEVERVLGMVDGVVLVVDATEGPMAQTKFVLSKALQAGLKPLVVLNKMDRNTIRVDEVENEIFELFANLEANDSQLSYPTLYASARHGWAVRNKDDEKNSITPLLDAIVEYVSPPKVTEPTSSDPNVGFSMLVTTLETDPFFGRIVTGKIYGGTARVGLPLKVIDREGNLIEDGKVFKVIARRGTDRIILDEGQAGDIIGLAGFNKAFVTHTLCSPEITQPIPSQPIDPPVLAMTFSVNTSPFAGTDGQSVTSTKLRSRLFKELENNVSMTVNPSPDGGESFEVKGRGELQMGILLENMRREGFEVSVSQPKVVMKKEDDQTLEPVEEVTIDVDLEYSGLIIEKMMKRKADMVDMKQSGGKCRLVFYCPSRGLLGFRSELTNDTRGTAVLNHLFHKYQPYKGQMEGLSKGAIISMEDGVATGYALESIQERGVLYIQPGAKIYKGMIIGEHSRDNDIDVNPVKTKHLSNVRTTQKEEFTRLNAPKILSLEDAIACVKDDELIEVTPKSIRIRKKELDTGARQRARKSGKD
eukprot:TRINITY_DN5135_c0_g1_i1.p1 TRINITY_DN5135_c0_g1~~TRINITY_DN5135_c0_g1_i1.p1  ORF type:complete len:692 (-),score=163.23 TRINITY_DN5135_c0_g1_i1:51-2126(-)